MINLLSPKSEDEIENLLSKAKYMSDWDKDVMRFRYYIKRLKDFYDVRVYEDGDDIIRIEFFTTYNPGLKKHIRKFWNDKGYCIKQITYETFDCGAGEFEIAYEITFSNEKFIERKE